MENHRDFEKELIATKQDLRVLKSFARKSSIQNKLLIQIISEIIRISLPHKIYDWENISEDNVADIITCYEIQHQDILSNGETLRLELDNALARIDECKSVIQECSTQLGEQKVQLELSKEAEILERDKNMKLTVELALSEENVAKANDTIRDLRNELAELQSKCLRINRIINIAC